jgi:DNA-binding transcriptional LysR family regulator
MLKLETIAAFTSVVEAGSITGAARRLAISKSVVSERLTDLERMLGTKLLRRTTRALSLTDDGKTFLERAQEILRRVDNAASEMSERRSSLEDLALHRGIIYGNRGAVDWRFRVNRKFAIVRPQVALRVNNGLLMRDAAVAGLGIALLPTFLLQIPLKKRILKVLDVGAEAEGATIYIAYPEHLRASGKIRGLTTWLQKAFGDPPHWDAGT